MEHEAGESHTKDGHDFPAESNSTCYEFTHVLGYQFARDETCSSTPPGESLAQSLHAELYDLLTLGQTQDPLPWLHLPLQHVTALLDTDYDKRLWRPLANYILYDGRDRLLRLGRLDLVRTALNAVFSWLPDFPGSPPSEPKWKRERWVCLTRLGDLAVSEGNLLEAQRLLGESLDLFERDEIAQSDINWDSRQAQQLFSESLHLFKRLAESDLGNDEWQRSLPVSLDGLGAMAESSGNTSESHRIFFQSLGIRKRLAESAPGNVEPQRDLSVSLEKLGNLAVSDDDLPKARCLFTESLDIRKRLAESDLGNAVWQRDLSVSFEKLGDVAVAEQNLSEAKRLFRESLTIVQLLTENDSHKLEWQHDLSVSLEKLGDVAVSEDDLPSAKRFFAESLDIRRSLCASDGGNALWQRDLSVSLGRLGEVAESEGLMDEAECLFEESLGIRQSLAESDPSNAAWQRDLSVSHWRMADILKEMEPPQAREHLQQAHDTLARLVEAGLFVSREDREFLEKLRGKLEE